MIFETLTYYDNDGGSIAVGNTTYPAQDFDMKVYQSNDAVKKTQYPGRWPTFSYAEYREIHVAGEILGDSASDFNTKSRALRGIITPPMRVFATARRHGELRMTFFGDAVTYRAYVIVDSFETPQEALYPSVGSYAITWIAFEPYLQNISTGAYVRDL